MLSKRWKKQIRRDARRIYCYNYQTLCQIIWLSCQADGQQMAGNFNVQSRKHIIALLMVSVLNTCLGRTYSQRQAYQYPIQANEVTVVPYMESYKIWSVKKFDICGIVVIMGPNMLQEGSRTKSKSNAHYLMGACDHWPCGFHAISTCSWTKCRGTVSKAHLKADV